MAKLGISTGAAPDDGTGSSLLVGAARVNSNFDELYTLLGAGSTTNLAPGIVTSIVAGDNINVSGSGQVTITSLASTAFLNAASLNVSGISTLSDDVTFLGGGQNLLWDKTDNLLWFKTNTSGGQSAKAWWGDGSSYGNLEIYRQTGGPNLITSQNSDLQIAAFSGGKVKLLSGDEVSIINSAQTTGYWIRCKENTNISDQYVNLYYGHTGTEANDIRLSTTSGGISVNGHVGASGSVTAATFYGNGAGLTGVGGGSTSFVSTKSLVVTTGMSTVSNMQTFDGTYQTVDRYTFDENLGKRIINSNLYNKYRSSMSCLVLLIFFIHKKRSFVEISYITKLNFNF